MNQKVKDLDEAIKHKRQELKLIEEAVAERNCYRCEQELAISELVDVGNTQLMGLTYEITLSTKILRDLKTDIRTAIQDKKVIMTDLQELSGGFVEVEQKLVFVNVLA